MANIQYIITFIAIFISTIIIINFAIPLFKTYDTKELERSNTLLRLITENINFACNMKNYNSGNISLLKMKNATLKIEPRSICILSPRFPNNCRYQHCFINSTKEINLNTLIDISVRKNNSGIYLNEYS
jgi:hypothetical protein